MSLERRVNDQYRLRYEDADVAQQYDDSSLKGPGRPRSLRYIIGRVVTLAEQMAIAKLLRTLPTGGTILDVPCGSGKEAPVLTERSRVIGADSSMAMLRLYARSGAPESLRADISSLPFKSRSFDVIVCNRLLHRLPPSSRTDVLTELHRVSRHWAVTYHGIDGLGQQIVMALERASGMGDRGVNYLSSRSAIQNEVERIGWKVLRGRAVMTCLSTGYLCVLEK